MSIRICILASGSSGNCTYIGTPENGMLVDAGLSARRTVACLAEIGVTPDQVRGICVSHEHSDHIHGLRVLHKRYGIPLYANAGTVDALERNPDLRALHWNVFTTGHPFTVGPMCLEPFSVPHDAYDPVGFVVQHEAVRVGVVTDMGMVTGLIRERLRSCHVLVVEANHDERLLQDAERPWSLKQRILGRQGHLSNQHAAELVAEIAHPELRHVFLAHLSEDCNKGELALQTACRALEKGGHTHVRVSLTYPDRISDVCVWEMMSKV
jgi:phosphoribosyl 1,2-cyclic phosphodiesterase